MEIVWKMSGSYLLTAKTIFDRASQLEKKQFIIIGKALYKLVEV